MILVYVVCRAVFFVCFFSHPNLRSIDCLVAFPFISFYYLFSYGVLSAPFVDRTSGHKRMCGEVHSNRTEGL